MSVFEFDSYKNFVKSWIKNQPKRGRGCYTKLAEALDISTVMVSQVFSGPKSLSLEHGFLLADFFGFNLAEKNYFLLLINYEKAGSHKLQQHYKSEIQKIRQQKLENLKEILPEDIALNDSDKAIFYSHWLYSAIRLQTAIKGFQTVDALAQRFHLSRQTVISTLQFLMDKKLCVQTSSGYGLGSNRTHLEADSPYIRPRQISWRVKGFEKMEDSKKSNLFYTGPMTISQELYSELRKKINDLVLDISNKIVNDTPDKLICLNIDLFEV